MPQPAGSPGEVADALAAEWGVDYPRIERLLRELAEGEWRTVAELVAATATSRRTVTGVLRRLEPFTDQDGRRTRLRAEAAEELARRLGEPGWSPAVDRWDAAGDPLVPRMEQLQQGLPAPRRALDHVAATAATAVKRARFLHERFRLAGHTLLCLGDRDLTALAVALVEPRARLLVVDVDEDVLAHVDRAARELGVGVDTRFADLRLGLPERLHRTADLVFTDPPYTPQGTRLFLARAVEALVQEDQARVVLAYGFGERQTGVALNVQEAMTDMRVVFEAVLPAFNRYRGAEALGSASALYLLRPTRRTWPAAARHGAADPRIYTHGHSAEEAAPDTLPAAALEVARGWRDGAIDVVGDGWDEPGRPVAALWADLVAGAGRARVPDGRLVDLGPSFGPLLPRLLLADRARRLLVAGGELPAGDPLRRLLAVAWEVERTGGLIAARRCDPPPEPAGQVLRALLDRAAGNVLNTWREGLIAAGRAETRNEARALMARSGGDALPPATLLELPLARLERLVEAVEASCA